MFTPLETQLQGINIWYVTCECILNARSGGVEIEMDLEFIFRREDYVIATDTNCGALNFDAELRWGEWRCTAESQFWIFDQSLIWEGFGAELINKSTNFGAELVDKSSNFEPNNNVCGVLPMITILSRMLSIF